MSLRTKISLLVLVLFATYAVVALAIQGQVIDRRFLELERAEAIKNIDRALAALQREIDLLVPSVNDWGLWDDTYRFVQDRNEEYVTANLNLATLQALAVNMFAIYDRAGGLVWGGAYDLNNGYPLELPRLIPPRLEAAHFLMQKLAAQESVAGIVESRAGPLLLVARTILTSEAEGPSMGTVVMGRMLDATAITRLAAQAQVDLRIVSLRGGANSSRPGAGRPGEIPRGEMKLLETPIALLGEVTVADIRGDPVLTLMVSTPRDISAAGRDAMSAASLSLAAAGGPALLLLLVAMRRIVLDPLSRLMAHASSVGIRGDLQGRLDLKRKDEIGMLAGEFDRMVERLAEAHERLLEHSYQAGIAENASGVLHNIGNAITPIGVKLGNLREDLNQIPAQEIRLASEELANHEIDPQRRIDMLTFLGLTTRELGVLTQNADQALNGIENQLEHVKAILADQHRHSRAQRLTEPVDCYRLLEEALGLLPENLRQTLRVEMDPALRRVPRVRVGRVALQQVMSNLIINAAEAGSAEGEPPRPVTLRVTAEEALLEPAPTMHMRFADNGVGISAEDLARIFERGFSTKGRGSGMGLHWCANTVAAFGGRIFAQSDGAGAGTCLHLLLPIAVAANGRPDGAA